MKILELKFKNLNSLQGEWTINFSAPEFTSNGIFAITGPTGAGKSTILDAICLALYGCTPRLSKITKSSNEIMSRQSGECFAEVLFESQKGKFRCHWSQHKARKKADGKLADPKHEISDDVTGKLIESKRSLVADEIEKRTGMDFSRFTRSILLAQGGFAVFLQASPDERAPILEQITGTEIYSLISEKVFERNQSESEKLKILNAETSGINILSTDDEAKIIEELAIKQKDKISIEQKYLETNKSIQWLNGIETLRKEIVSIAIEAKNHTESIEAFKPNQEKLLMANKASELDGSFATLTTTRKQQKSEIDLLKNKEDLLPNLEKSMLEQEKLLQVSEQNKINLKNQQKLEAPIIQKVRSLDLTSFEKGKSVKAAEAENKKIAAQIAENRLKLTKSASAKKNKEKEQKNLQSFLESNSQDELLINQFEAISELINNLKIVSNEHLYMNEKLEKQQKLVEKVEINFQTKEKEFEVQKKADELSKQKVQQHKNKLESLLNGRLLREYRSDYNFLVQEKVYLQKIASYEDDRKKLEDGKPCELCGSIDHPYAAGNIPKLDATEKKCADINALIEKAENFETEIKELENSQNKIQQELVNIDKEFAKVIHEKETSQKYLKQLNEELKTSNQKLLKAKNQTLEKLGIYGIKEIPESKTESILSSLNKRLQDWNNNKSKYDKIESQLNQFSNEINSIEGIIANIEPTLDDKKKTLIQLQQDHAILISEREKLYGTKKPDDEEAILEKQIINAEKSENITRQSYEKAKIQFSEHIALVKSLKENISKRSIELKTLEQEFTSSLTKIGFIDEIQFINCRMTAEERKALSDQGRKLEDKKAEIFSRKTDRETRLQKELEKTVTDSSIELLQVALTENEAILKRLGEEIGGIKQKLTDNTEAKASLKDKKILIDKQNLECQKWGRLHALIGSKTGKKYRNFAQGITFELMVKQANQQLGKMTDRYLLTRDSDNPLELNVIDNYQAGEMRSTKNLSGGESFIVSLALALGLSKMASQKVRVDSLFLDEGFGTLDESALEIALETLAGLQDDGKLIGVISHVSALKERISAQINVQPISGGRSKITGPGVSKN